MPDFSAGFTIGNSQTDPTSPYVHQGGPLVVAVQGVWGGATLTLHASLDNSTFGALIDDGADAGYALVAGTDDNVHFIVVNDLPPCSVHLVPSSAGGTTALSGLFYNSAGLAISRGARS